MTVHKLKQVEKGQASTKCGLTIAAPSSRRLPDDLTSWPHLVTCEECR